MFFVAFFFFFFFFLVSLLYFIEFQMFSLLFAMCNKCILLRNLNVTPLRMAKTLWSFDRSECNRVNAQPAGPIANTGS